MVRDAILCARSAGQVLFGKEGDWAIFFASDSAAARQLALAETVQWPWIEPPIFLSRAQPVHSDLLQGNGPGKLWASLGDQLLLARARGLVQCEDHSRKCRESGYSQ